jgi:hypothetical protein
MAVLLSLALLGCGGGAALNKRAVGYYNFMAGLSPKTKYSSFFSPAYREQFQGDGLQAVDRAVSTGAKPNTRYKPAKAADVTVATAGNFAYTAVSPSLGPAFAGLRPQRWVRDGRGWYLYMGSDAEVRKYGQFPFDLTPPAPAAGADAAEADADAAEKPAAR